MPDPMSLPPVDHGSDRYDYVEVEAPEGVNPDGMWWDLIVATPCPDCRANVFARFVPRGLITVATQGEQQHWQITIAHDETCPFPNRRT